MNKPSPSCSSAIGAVGQLALATRHIWQPGQLFVLVTVYIDESGTHQSGVMVIAGWVGALGQWTEFDARWRRMLSRADVEYFHMKSLKHNQGPFKGWSIERKDALLRAASKVLHRNLQFGFTIAVGDEDYRQHYRSGQDKLRRQLDSQYGLCFRLCFSLLPKLITSAWHGREIDLHFVVEGGHRNIGDASRIFGEFQRDRDSSFSNLFRGFTVGRYQDYYGLQGADIPAHIGFDHERNGEVPVMSIEGTAETAVVRKARLSSAPLFRIRATPDVLVQARSLLQKPNRYR